MKTIVKNINSKAASECELRKLIKKVFLERRQINKAYSLASLAKDLGISKSILSRVLSGDRPASLKLAIHITTVLGIKENVSKNVVLSVLQAQSKNAKVNKIVRAKLEAEARSNKPREYTNLDVEQFRAIASWHHLAILNLTELKTFKSCPLWISKKLGISTTEVRDAIERLIAIGLLTEGDRGLSKTNKSLFINTSRSEIAVRKFHEQMITKAHEVLQDGDQKKFEKRLINAITITCEEKHIALIQEKINQLQDEILNLTTTSEATELYQMNVQLFPLTKNSKQEN